MKYLLIKLLLVALFLSLSVVFSQATSETTDNKLLCAFTHVTECDSLGECHELTTADAGLPDFVLIDLQAKKLFDATSGGVHETRFNTSSSKEGMTILTGIDGLRGWSAVLSNNNTRLSATISDDLAGFVVFGACRIKP